MKIEEIDRVIKQAKLFLNQNSPPQETKHWVDAEGVVHQCPPGTFFDYKTNSFRPLKVR